MKILSCTLLLIVFWGSNGLIAQENQLGKEDLLNIPISQLLDIQVIGPSRFKESKSEAPATMIVFTAEEIRQKGYFDLSDLLMDVPGIDFVDNARGYGEYYTIRGIEGNDRFLVLIDGEKINPPSGTFLSVGNSISISFASQVEVIYGPASVVYGADAFAGIVNIITKEATENFSLNARYGLGSNFSNDLYLESSSKLKSGISFFASARFFSSNGPDFSGRDSIYDIIKRYHPPQRPNFEQPIRDHTVFIKGQYKELTLSYFRQGFNEGNALGIHPNGFIYNKENHWKTSNNLLTLAYDKEFNDRSQLSMQLSGILNQIDPSTQWYKWFSLYQVDSSVSQYMTGRDQTIRFSLNHKYSIRPNLDLLSGLESEFSNYIPPYANEQVFQDSRKFEGTDAQIIRDQLTISELRLAGLAQISYHPNQYMQLLLGVRFDYSNRYKGVFNPRSALILTPSDQTQIKFLFGSAFQAPSLFLAYEQFADPWLVMYSIEDYQKLDPSWSLEPQRVQTYEIYLSQEITPNITISGDFYYSALTDLIGRSIFSDSVNNPRYSTPDQPVFSSGLVNANFGEQKVQGSIIRLIGRKRNLFYELSYAFTNAYTRTDGEDIPISRVAKHKALAVITWSNNFFTLSPRIRWIGKINNQNQVAFPSGFQPGFSQVDLNIRSKEIIPGLYIYGYVKNLFNSHIEHGGLQRQAFGYLPTVLQDGINFRLGVQYSITKPGGGE